MCVCVCVCVCVEECLPFPFDACIHGLAIRRCDVSAAISVPVDTASRTGLKRTTKHQIKQKKKNKYVYVCAECSFNGQTERMVYFVEGQVV